MAVLQAAIVAEGFRLFAATMRDHVAAAPKEGRAQVLAIATGYVEFAVGNPDLFRLMFSMERQLDIFPDLLPASREAYAVLRDVSKWVEAKDRHSAEGRVAVETMLWTWVHGYACLKVNRQFYTSNAEIGRDPELADVMPAFDYMDATDVEPEA
ncbi:TetR-like C-terminal domain-containing protein [Roseibium sp.]|uniref:TetR-like C-terminal domain-containing protein n=1 Tax=Roseibium sp. TaxID=1936156 RepID=UPI003A980179